MLIDQQNGSFPWAAPFQLTTTPIWIKFEFATKPACKTAIALGAFAGITFIISDSPNAFGIGGCVLIGVLALIIGTYTMPPLCARSN
jgi:hypothetical protein